MKALLFIAALASPALAGGSTADVHVTLHGMTTVSDVLAFANALGKNIQLGLSSDRPDAQRPVCPVTVIAPATLNAAEANQLFFAVLDKMKLAAIPTGRGFRIVRLEPTPIVLPAVFVRCTPVTLEFPVRVSP